LPYDALLALRAKLAGEIGYARQESYPDSYLSPRESLFAAVDNLLSVYEREPALTVYVRQHMPEASNPSDPQGINPAAYDPLSPFGPLSIRDDYEHLAEVLASEPTVVKNPFCSECGRLLPKDH
jgi:hypothetical protein